VLDCCCGIARCLLLSQGCAIKYDHWGTVVESPNRAVSMNEDDFLVGRTKVNWTTNCYLNCKFVICALQFEFLIILSVLTWQETCENGQLRNFPSWVTPSTTQHSWDGPSHRIGHVQQQHLYLRPMSGKQIHSPATAPVASHYYTPVRFKVALESFQSCDEATTHNIHMYIDNFKNIPCFLYLFVFLFVVLSFVSW
jgi:hypothetical protein